MSRFKARAAVIFPDPAPPSRDSGLRLPGPCARRRSGFGKRDDGGPWSMTMDFHQVAGAACRR